MDIYSCKNPSRFWNNPEQQQINNLNIWRSYINKNVSIESLTEWWNTKINGLVYIPLYFLTLAQREMNCWTRGLELTITFSDIIISPAWNVATGN